MSHINLDHVAGKVQGFQINSGLWTPATAVISNQIMYDWGVITASLLRNLSDKQYYTAGMYFEFDNSGADVDPVPTIDRADKVDYYTGLSGTKDFLRVPLIATSGSASSGDFSGNNVATFMAQTSGTAGQRTTAPLTFSDAANSRVFGGALVAFRQYSDITQDLIFSRFYFDPGSQVEKLASSQIGLTWSITLD